MSDNNPTAVLIDVSGSQVGTPTNPFFISGSCPPVNITNIINVGSTQSGADPNATYVLTQPTGSLVSGSSHMLLRELIHLSDDDGPRGAQWPNNMVKDTHNALFPTGSVWWTSSARTQRVVDCTITRNSMRLPVSVQWRAYASDGVTVVESYTDTITYNGVFETSRTRSQP